MAQKIDLDINKLDWLAIARVMAPILAPIVLAVAWVTLSKFDKKVDWLSNLFAISELIPTVDLNLPSGIVLGSFYNSAEEILEKGMTADLKNAWEDTSSLLEDFIKKEGIYEKKEDPIIGGIASFFNWLEKKVEESDVEFGGKGLA